MPLTNVTTGANVGSLTQHQHICPSLRAVTLEHHNVYTVHYIPCRLGLRLDIRLFVNAVALMTDWLNGAACWYCPSITPLQLRSCLQMRLLSTTHTACWRYATKIHKSTRRMLSSNFHDTIIPLFYGYFKVFMGIFSANSAHFYACSLLSHSCNSFPRLFFPLTGSQGNGKKIWNMSQDPVL